MNKLYIIFLIIFLFIELVYCKEKNPFDIPEMVSITPQIYHHTPISISTISKNGQYIATAGGIEILVWEAKSKKILHRFHLLNSSPDINIIGLEFSNEIDKLFAITNKNQKWVFSLKNSQLIKIEKQYNTETSAKNIEKPNLQGQFLKISPIMTEVSISQNNRYVAMLGSDGIIRLWDTFSVELLGTINSGNMKDIRVSYIQDKLWGIDINGIVYEWDIKETDNPKLLKKKPLLVDKSFVYRAKIGYLCEEVIVLSYIENKNSLLLSLIDFENSKVIKQKELFNIPKHISMNLDNSLIALDFNDRVVVYNSNLKEQDKFIIDYNISSLDFDLYDNIFVTYEGKSFIDSFSLRQEPERFFINLDYPVLSSTYSRNVAIITDLAGRVSFYNLLHAENVSHLLFFDEKDFFFYFDYGYFLTSKPTEVIAIKWLDIVNDELENFNKPDLIRGRLIELIGNISY